ncbi:MAG TPA: ATP-binding protein [Candidatus Polarisedimenticolaceae bacterium]|nr:ATP-binding protein [Candidatus Polarisedimenticolaceae bacterium]
MSGDVLSMLIAHERDVVLARQRARQIAALVGFDIQDQTNVATAISEIARNAWTYARGGRVDFRIEGRTAPQLLVVAVADEGPGIADLAAVLEGRYRSATGLGQGISGARRLMDQFDVRSSSQVGTLVVLKKLLPRRAEFLDRAALARITAELARAAPVDAFQELQRQNQELLAALDELERRRDELATLNRELADTNRGVVALYAELDERADYLRRADELKSRFLSNMSHEFRTPVNSILALSRMLLDRSDGELTPEQERQVTFIRRAGEALSELVNDFLDLAKVEAGKIEIHPLPFDVAHLFGALRGMLRPLLVNDAVALVIEDPADPLTLDTDEAKVSQILRNFVSNALKFTERGEVRVTAQRLPGERVAFSVSDSGIGIAVEDQERIFQEFTQIDSPVQRRVQGTGLGLPLCRKLAELLGGGVSLVSAPNAGSTFTAEIPIVYVDAVAAMPSWERDPRREPVLVIEDSPETVLFYEKTLAAAGYQVLAARTLREARDAVASFQPRAILLDILLKGEDAWAFLSELKRRPDTRAAPVAVISTVDDRRKALALGAETFCLKPLDRQRLLQTLTLLVAPETVRRVLLADDEEVFRYVLRQHLQAPHYEILEAESGSQALELARTEQPDVVCLDLSMPDLDGQEVLRRLKSDPSTRHIPVVVVTSRVLDEAARLEVRALAADVLSKESVSRESALAAVSAAVRPLVEPS